MKKGFTLVEILIVLSVLGIIAAIVMFSFSSVSSSGALDRSVSDVISALSQARSETLSSKDNSSYGVRFEQSEVIIFKESYSPGNSENVTISLSGPTLISNVSLGGGGSEVLFERFTGNAATGGTVTLTNNAGSTKVITIYETGLFETN